MRPPQPRQHVLGRRSVNSSVFKPIISTKRDSRQLGSRPAPHGPGNRRPAWLSLRRDLRSPSPTQEHTGNILRDFEDPQQPEGPQDADPEGGSWLDGSPDHFKDAPHNDLCGGRTPPQAHTHSAHTCTSAGSTWDLAGAPTHMSSCCPQGARPRPSAHLPPNTPTLDTPQARRRQREGQLTGFPASQLQTRSVHSPEKLVTMPGPWPPPRPETPV